MDNPAGPAPIIATSIFTFWEEGYWNLFVLLRVAVSFICTPPTAMEKVAVRHVQMRKMLLMLEYLQMLIVSSFSWFLCVTRDGIVVYTVYIMCVRCVCHMIMSLHFDLCDRYFSVARLRSHQMHGLSQIAARILAPICLCIVNCYLRNLATSPGYKRLLHVTRGTGHSTAATTESHCFVRSRPSTGDPR